jgi:hypothetical protein
VSFPAIERYDEALFQYFQPVPLDRLDDEQVRQLLFARAAFDKLDGFAERYRVNQDRIRALTRLTGGNPRLAMMLYETITTGSLPTIVQQLQGLVDSLTPLLKDVLDHQMTPQQAKVMDALMRAGGTAQPRDLVASTRLTLNAVNTQLTRLKEMQLLDVLGGGKGRPAYYTVPDRLFSTWYQLRYLRPNRRRIEIFVEFLRVWFEEDARCEYLKCQQGDTAGEIADLRAAAAQAGASEEVRAVVTAGVLKRVVRGTALDEAVVFARQVSTHFPAAAIPRFIIAVLRRSADAGMRPHWPRICRALCENQPPEVAEKLAFLLPVCEVLETNDRSRLDPLPPEQRDFALEVLRGFEVAS